MPGNTDERDSVQKIILALLLSRKDPVTLLQLHRDYKEQEGEYIPWKKFGYISLLNYLKSIPSAFQLQKINGIYYVRGIPTDKSKHVHNLVSHQRTVPKKPPYARSRRPSCLYPWTQRPRIQISADILSDIIRTVRQNPNGVNKEHILRKVREQLPHVHISITDLEEQIRVFSHELYMQGNLVFSTQSKAKCISSEILTKTEEKLQAQNMTAPTRYCISGDSDSEFNIDDDNDFSFVPSDSISSNGKENNEIIVLKKKIPISKFIQETVSKCHVQGDKINDTSTHDITENGLYNRQNNVTLDTATEKECQGDVGYYDTDSPKLINERIRFLLEKLILKYPDGIWCAELPEKFLQEYNRPLNYIELGFNSVREFASFLPEIFQCKQLQSLGDFILYDAKHELNNEKKKDRMKSESITEFSQFYQETEEVEPLPTIVSSDTSIKLMPEGVMTIGETVGQISVIDLESRLQPYIEVFVEEVFTPSFFWVQLRKKKKLFNKLMEDLHAFYEEKSALYKIPVVVLEKGLNCACVYNKQWHRGIIKQVKPDLQVTVMFYDYGTLKTYPPEAIYYLHHSFSYLPAQAIPCGLYNTKPCIGEQWSRGVTHEFAFRTTQRPLIATIVSTDPENNSMLVTLTDTMEEDDVHINDWLVQQNLALHGKMVRIRPRNFPYCYYLHCKKNHKTNPTASIISKSDITEIKNKQKCKIVHRIEKELQSNHALSTSINSSSHHYLSSIDSKKDIQISQKLEKNSIQGNNTNRKSGLALFLEKIENSRKSSSSSCETKSNNTQLHSDTNMIYSEKNESKTELEKADNSNYTSSFMKSNDAIPITFQNNYLLKIQLQKQDNYSTKANYKKYVENQDTNISIQQNEQEKKTTSILKTCFLNAVNLSVDSKPYCPDHDTLPDDNITMINDTSKLITKRKRKINLKNIEIGLSETTLTALSPSINHANNKCIMDTSENVTSSSNQFQNIINDSQQRNLSDNETVIPNVQKHFNKSDINGTENDEFSDRSLKSCNMSEEECMLSNKIKGHKLTTNNPLNSNSNSVSIYENNSANRKNTIYKLETFNTLLKIYNTCNDDSILDSDDSSNLDNYNINSDEIETKISSSISSTNRDTSDEEKSNFVYNDDTNESISETEATLLESEENKAKETTKYDETINMNPDKEAISSYNENDNEWDIVGDIHDFFPNYFLSNVDKNYVAKNVDDKHVQITEITENE